MKIKGGDFLIHKTNPLSIFIPEEWNEEQIMLKDMVQDFLKKELHGLPEEPDASKDLSFISNLIDIFTLILFSIERSKYTNSNLFSSLG